MKRSELAGWANYGYCPSYSRWYWGLKLYLITTPEVFLVRPDRRDEPREPRPEMAYAYGHESVV